MPSYLYYSILHELLLNAAKDFIEENGTVSFQNACCISVNAFVDLLTNYSRAILLWFDSKHFLQKCGSIGSCGALILADVFLSFCERRILETGEMGGVRQIFRYADDILILYCLQHV